MQEIAREIAREIAGKTAGEIAGGMTVAGERAGAGVGEAGSGAGAGVERAGTGEAIAAGGEESFAKGKGVVVIDVVAMLSKMGAKAGAAAGAGVKGENIKGHTLTLCNSSRISAELS